MEDEDAHLSGAHGLSGTLKRQWLDFKAFVNIKMDHRGATTADKAQPAGYWIRTRHHWRELSEMMLYWLAVPISTACVERAFSFMTTIDANARRRRLKEPHFRDNLKVALHRPWLQERLTKALHMCA